MTSLPDEDLSPWPARLACLALALAGCGLGVAYLAWLDLPRPPKSLEIVPLTLLPIAAMVLTHKLGWLRHRREGRAPGHLFAWAAICAPLASVGVWPLTHGMWTDRALEDADARFATLLADPRLVELAGHELEPTAAPSPDVEEPGWVVGARFDGAIGGRGVVITARDGALHVEPLHLALPEELQAHGPEDVAWIALAQRTVIEDAYQYGTSLPYHADVEHLELDVRDRADLAPLARIAAEAVPPARARRAEGHGRHELPAPFLAEKVARELGR